MSDIDKTAAQRQQSRRQRVIAEGGRAVHLLIPHDINRALTTEIERTGESASAAALRLIAEALGVVADVGHRAAGTFAQGGEADGRHGGTLRWPSGLDVWSFRVMRIVRNK